MSWTMVELLRVNAFRNYKLYLSMFFLTQSESEHFILRDHVLEPLTLQTSREGRPQDFNFHWCVMSPSGGEALVPPYSVSFSAPALEP